MSTVTKLKSYTGGRKDVISMLQVAPTRCLDIGCSNGALGAAIKEKYPAATVVGVDYDSDFVKVAQTRLDHAVCLDLDNGGPVPKLGSFDLIILADVLEHLRNPKDVLRNILEQNAADGCRVVISVPNVQHVTVIFNVIMGVWPERDRGIFDRTHLRWFTLRTLKNLAQSSDLDIVKIRRNYRFFDTPGLRINKLARLFALPLLRNFFAYQYVVLMRAKKIKPPEKSA
ncbi:MAG: methyltransferase domain-containing protein [Rhodobacteraceae bacterium]|nr:methyltransferase domain-containing protein [Paracoccaceae bacterium]